MGRKSRDKKQNSEDSTPDQSHNEEGQQGEPIDPDPDQVIMPDPEEQVDPDPDQVIIPDPEEQDDPDQVIMPDSEEQDDPEPNPQQEEIHQDPPVDPIPIPSQEEQEIHPDLQDDWEQNLEQEGEIHQNLPKHQEQEGEMHQNLPKHQEQEGEIHQNLPKHQEQEGEIHQNLPKHQEQEGEIHQNLPKHQEQEGEIRQNLKKQQEQDEIYQEQDVEEEVPRALNVEVAEQQEILIAELNAEDQLEEVLQLSQESFDRETEPAMGIKQEIEINTAETKKGNETSINAKGEIDENVQQEPLLVLREIRRLLGLQDITDFPALVDPHSIELQPTQLMAAPTHMSLPLFPENSTSSWPREVLDDEAEMRSNLKKSEDLEQADRSSLSSQSHTQAPVTLAIGLRKPMKARARKHKKRKEPSKPGSSDSIEYLGLMEHENQSIEDPGEPDFADFTELIKQMESENAELSSPDELEFSDSRELLKDLNFGEMKADNQETKLVGDMKLETSVNLETENDEDLKTEVSENTITEASGSLETEGRVDLKTETEGESKTEVDENLETEADTFLETEEDDDLEMENYEDLEMDNLGLVAVEVCEPPLPPPARPPPEDRNWIPDDLEEDPPNEELPNDEGNRPSNRRALSESDESTRERRGLLPCKMNAFCIFVILVGLIIMTITNTILFLDYYHNKSNETQNGTTPRPIIDPKRIYEKRHNMSQRN